MKPTLLGRLLGMQNESQLKSSTPYPVRVMWRQVRWHWMKPIRKSTSPKSVHEHKSASLEVQRQTWRILSPQPLLASTVRCKLWWWGSYDTSKCIPSVRSFALNRKVVSHQHKRERKIYVIVKERWYNVKLSVIASPMSWLVVAPDVRRYAKLHMRWSSCIS